MLRLRYAALSMTDVFPIRDNYLLVLIVEPQAAIQGLLKLAGSV